MPAGKRFTIARLEQALSMWEELMWLTTCISKESLGMRRDSEIPMEGPLLHYQELRKHLLSLKSIEDFDWKRFTFPGSSRIIKANGVQGLFPYHLASWCTNSRRVYHLEPDLQAILMSTSLKDLTWADVAPRFQSFGVSLEEPIRSLNNQEYDFILVTPINRLAGKDVLWPELPIGEWPWNVALFKTRMSHWKPTSLRREINRKVRLGDIEGAERIIFKKNLLEKNIALAPATTMVHRGKNSQVSKVLGALKDTAGDSRADHVALRLVVGLCMYRSRLPLTSHCVSDWERLRRTSLPTTPIGSSAVTDESEVCTLSWKRPLSPEDRELFFRYASGRLSGIELECHFREGHWRRPPGTAQIVPAVEQTVHVDPTIVRPDRWPEGGLPLGSRVVLRT